MRSMFRLLLTVFVAVLPVSAFADFGSAEVEGLPSLIGEELIIEVLPENVNMTQEQEQRLEEAGYVVVQPVVFASSDGIVSWVKAVTGQETDAPIVYKMDLLRGRVVGVENEATSSSGNHTFSGMASYYGGRHSRRHGGGEFTAAHRSLPFGTKVRVTHGGRSVIVVINDRGPFIRGRVIDIDTGAARALGLTGKGVGRVQCEVM